MKPKKQVVLCRNEEELEAVTEKLYPEYWKKLQWSHIKDIARPSQVCLYLGHKGWDRLETCKRNGDIIITANDYLKGGDKMRSLQDIYNETLAVNGGEPVKVLQRIPCGDRADTFVLIGIDENTDTAFGYYEKRENNLIRRTASKKQWLAWEPEPVPHWPALREAQYSPVYTGTLYPNEERARKCLGAGFIRLVTEYPPVMILDKNTN